MSELRSLIHFPAGSLLSESDTLDQKVALFGRTELLEQVTYAEKIASIRQTDMEPSDDEFAALDVFAIGFNDLNQLRSICSHVFAKFDHPRLVILQCENQAFLTACRTTPPGKNGNMDKSTTIKKRTPLSHFLYPDEMSAAGLAFLGKINSTLCSYGSIEEISLKIVQLIEEFPLGGFTNKRWVQAVINYLQPRMKKAEVEALISTCFSWKDYGDAHSRSFHYGYDTEEIWHLLMHTEPFCTILTNRKTPDMERLLYDFEAYKIDQKMKNI